MTDKNKKCPLCAETIPLEAAACEYCGARFAVSAAGYCTNCHEMRAADAEGRCKVCGTEITDRRVGSKLIEEPALQPAQAPTSRTAPPPNRRNRRWILGGIGGFGLLVLIIILGLTVFYKGVPQPAAIGKTTFPSTATLEPAKFTPTSMQTLTAAITPTTIPWQWIQLNDGRELPHDTITAIALNPRDPDVIYVGTENSGIYKTVDAGLSWHPSSNGLGQVAVDTLVIDTADPQVLYAGILLGGVFKTTDGGASWQAANTGIELPGWELASIVLIDPVDSRHLFYATAHSPVYESRNAGSSWKPVQASKCPDAVIGLIVHPIDSMTLFAAQRNDLTDCTPGVYKSSDGGKTWKFTGPEGTEGSDWGLGRLAIDQQQGEYLYLAANAGLFLSVDGGATWRKVRYDACTALAVDPNDGRTVYCAIWEIVTKTTDAGVIWGPQRNHNPSIRAIAVSPSKSATVFFGGQGLSISTDGGQTSVDRSQGLGMAHLELSLDGRASILYLTRTDECQAFRSDNWGVTWQSMTGRGCWIAFDADGKTQYWFDPNSTLLWAFADANSKGYSRTLPGKANSIASVFADPVIPAKLYGLSEDPTQAYLWVSSDSGETWKNTYTYDSILCGGRLFFDRKGQTIYASGRCGIRYSSLDNGESWQLCKNEISKEDFPSGWWSSDSSSQLAIDPRNGRHLYQGTRGAGVLLSLDGCQSWKPSNTGLGNLFINALAIDPDNPDIVYAGTGGGAYVSLDSGQTWGSIHNGLGGMTAVYSLIIDPQNNVYAVSSSGTFKLKRQ